MLVQRRLDGLRLFEQHDHALICGDMARAWRGCNEPEPALGGLDVLAIGLHDQPWREADLRPLYNPASGRPHDFIDLPMKARLGLYSRGIDRLEALNRYVALLVSRHYSTFKGMERQVAFQQQEDERRRPLQARLPAALADVARQDRVLALLKLFDVLSLYVCLAAPGAEHAWLPGWLDPERFARYPDGTRFTVRWESENRLGLEPFPWHRPFTVTLPWRELSGDAFGDQHALDAAFDAAVKGTWAVELV